MRASDFFGEVCRQCLLFSQLAFEWLYWVVLLLLLLLLLLFCTLAWRLSILAFCTAVIILLSESNACAENRRKMRSGKIEGYGVDILDELAQSAFAAACLQM